MFEPSGLFTEGHFRRGHQNSWHCNQLFREQPILPLTRSLIKFLRGQKCEDRLPTDLLELSAIHREVSLTFANRSRGVGKRLWGLVPVEPRYWQSIKTIEELKGIAIRLRGKESNVRLVCKNGATRRLVVRKAM